MIRPLRDLIRFLDRFFFGRIDTLPLGVFRFFFGLTAVVMYSFRQAHWRFYFTNEGFVQSEWAIQILPEFYRPILTWYPSTPVAAFIMHSALVGALVLITVGLWSRWAAIVAFVLHLAFIQRNFSIVYGADIVSSFFFFGLMFTDSDRNFSLRAWWNARRGRVLAPLGEINSMLTTTGVRLVQIQLCIIYGYTGLEKLKGGSWWEGTAVWTVFGNQQIMMYDLSWLMNFPVLIGLMTFSALLFEVYFPVLIWVPVTRKWTMIYGWLMHAGIAVFMGLVFFSAAMMSVYFLFIEPHWLRAQLARVVPVRWLGPVGER